MDIRLDPKIFKYMKTKRKEPNLSNRIAEVNLQEINDNGNVKVKLIDENSFKFKLA